jgi:hypothetical protein
VVVAVLQEIGDLVLVGHNMEVMMNKCGKINT